MASQERKRRTALFSAKHSTLRPETVSALADLQDLSSVIAEAHGQTIGTILPKRPEGAFTVSEYAAQTGISVTTSQARMNRLVDRFGYERLRAYHPSVDGKITPTTFYRKKVL